MQMGPGICFKRFETLHAPSRAGEAKKDTPDDFMNNLINKTLV